MIVWDETGNIEEDKDEGVPQEAEQGGAHPGQSSRKTTYWSTDHEEDSNMTVAA